MKRTSVCFLLLAALSAGDTLQLKDGRLLRGSYRGGTAGQVRFESNGRVQTFTIGEIDALSFRDGTGASALPADRDRDRNGDDRYRGQGSDRYRGDVNDRDRMRNSETGYPTSTSASSSSAGRFTAPTGTTVTVRMIDAINSDTNSVGQTFRASLDEPLVVEGQTLIPAGADATVQVVRVEQGGRLSGREEVALALSEVVANGRRYRLSTENAEVASKARGSQTAKVVGGTAVVGAIIGAIAGGGKGAAIGAASGAGAGAAVQAIRGQRVEIPSEAKLDFRLSQPLTLN